MQIRPASKDIILSHIQNVNPNKKCRRNTSCFGGRFPRSKRRIANIVRAWECVVSSLFVSFERYCSIGIISVRTPAMIVSDCPHFSYRTCGETTDHIVLSTLDGPQNSVFPTPLNNAEKYGVRLFEFGAPLPASYKCFSSAGMEERYRCTTLKKLKWRRF